MRALYAHDLFTRGVQQQIHQSTAFRFHFVCTDCRPQISTFRLTTLDTKCSVKQSKCNEVDELKVKCAKLKEQLEKTKRDLTHYKNMESSSEQADTIDLIKCELMRSQRTPVAEIEKKLSELSISHNQKCIENSELRDTYEKLCIQAENIMGEMRAEIENLKSMCDHHDDDDDMMKSNEFVLPSQPNKVKLSVGNTSFCKPCCSEKSETDTARVKCDAKAKINDCSEEDTRYGENASNFDEMKSIYGQIATHSVETKS